MRNDFDTSGAGSADTVAERAALADAMHELGAEAAAPERAAVAR